MTESRRGISLNKYSPTFWAPEEQQKCKCHDTSSRKIRFWLVYDTDSQQLEKWLVYDTVSSWLTNVMILHDIVLVYDTVSSWLTNVMKQSCVVHDIRFDTCRLRVSRCWKGSRNGEALVADTREHPRRSRESDLRAWDGCLHPDTLDRRFGAIFAIWWISWFWSVSGVCRGRSRDHPELGGPTSLYYLVIDHLGGAQRAG